MGGVKIIMDRFIYQVSDSDPSEFAQLVVALNEKEAIDMVWKDGEYGGEKEDLMAEELADTDKVFSLRDKSYIVKDYNILREYGFFIEGDHRCECCGLAEMSGKYRLCEECGMCEDCGHEEDCKNKWGVEK